MTESGNQYGLDLGKHKRHERKFPWGLMRKIIVAFILLGLLVYLNYTLNKKAGDQHEIEIEFDTFSNGLGASPDQ